MNYVKNVKNVFRFFKKKEILPIVHSTEADHLLDGKIVFITGGTGGIGQAIAKCMLESGAKVILGGTRQEKIDSSLRHFSQWKEDVRGIIVDLANPEAASSVVSSATSLFGKIDIFINSAGVHTEQVDFWNISIAEYDRVMKINLRGVFFYCRAVAEYMKTNHVGGNILLISSSRGSEPAFSPYGISKWGLNGFTKGLAKELISDGIIVNGLAPGSTATPLLGFKEGDSISSDENMLGRLVLPDEIAEWAKMLVGPSGRMVDGETVLVAGGRGGFDIR